MPTICQVNFGWDISEEQLAETSNTEKAKLFWDVPGLKWKIFLRDSDRKESGGIYFFADRASAQAYIDGPIGAAIKKFPHSNNHSFKLFDVREDVSSITGGPLDAEMQRG